MDKYIKADDFLEAIYPADPENDGSDGCTVVAQSLTLTSEELEAMIDSLPAADVAPVMHSKWELTGKNHTGPAKCQKCGFLTYDGGSYCPSCGAKMDLEG